MPQCVSGFEVDEVGDREQCIVHGVTGEGSGERWFRIDDGAPGRYRVEAGEYLGTLGADQSGQLRVELRTGASVRQFGCGLRPSDPMGHLDELGELAQSSGNGDLLAT